MTPEAEGELITRCLRGDDAAWEAFFAEHYAPTGRFIFQLSASLTWEDADEICQETFISVIHHLGGFHQGSRLQTWIFKIARNKTRDYLEKLSAAKRGGGQSPVSLNATVEEGGLGTDPVSMTPAPDVRLEEAERHAAVGAGLEQLGEPCREIIDLRYFGDLSYEEIAASLELNVKTVSSRLSKCLDRFEEILRKLAAGKGEVFPSNLESDRESGSR